jgi:hypothetical protein
VLIKLKANDYNCLSMWEEWTIQEYKGEQVSYLKERDQRNDPGQNESTTCRQN